MRTALQALPRGSETHEQLLLTEFRRAADRVPAYRTLLDERGVRVDQVCDFSSFSRLCPLLSRTNTFDRFPLAQLSVGGELGDVADVLTSSGHGGRFSFGVISRAQAAATASFTDAALDAAFGVTSKATLAINCLPMGVVLSSHCMTVATTSVREDMAVALVQEFGGHYEQIVLVGDPLFIKRLTDYAAEKAVDWRRYRVSAVLGEEVFGEHFRGYVAQCLGMNLDRPDHGHIMSSFGVGELGLHLCFETPATIALRREAAVNLAFARDLLGEIGAGRPLPMIFTCNPQRTFIEAIEPDRDGYGTMTISMLDPARSVPLLRYQTGDVVRLLDREQVIAAVRRHGINLPGDLPGTLVALQGRRKDLLPNGSHVAFYKDALYADHQIARQLTGAFRLIFSSGRCTMHVQLTRGQAPQAALEQGILRAIRSEVRPAQLVLWPYVNFPFGVTLDYQRKFSHYVSAELNVDINET
jgi:phenylacetate-CoA ligase